jgi:heme-degrading monooxygenase HmoA
MTIARTWRGATRAEDAAVYTDYMNRTGVPGYAATPGNLGVLMLRRIEGDRAEFLMVTLWESEEAIRGFAGDDISRAVFYDEDDRYLVDRETIARHWEVASTAGGEEGNR